MTEDGYNENHSNRDIEDDYRDMLELIGDSDSEDEEPMYMPIHTEVSDSNNEQERNNDHGNYYEMPIALQKVRSNEIVLNTTGCYDYYYAINE